MYLCVDINLPQKFEDQKGRGNRERLKTRPFKLVAKHLWDNIVLRMYLHIVLPMYVPKIHNFVSFGAQINQKKVQIQDLKKWSRKSIKDKGISYMLLCGHTLYKGYLLACVWLFMCLPTCSFIPGVYIHIHKPRSLNYCCSGCHGDQSNGNFRLQDINIRNHIYKY